MSETVDRAKRAVGRASADMVESGMRVGLGTGSTIAHVLDRLAERIREEGLELVGIASSKVTTMRARELGIPLQSLDEVAEIDLAIDGADEVDPYKNLMKGGGGALVREKIIAAAAREMVVVVDESKMVGHLGETFPLPVEVLAFGHKLTAEALRRLSLVPEIRFCADRKPYRSDNGNMIFDCKLSTPADIASLEYSINRIPGVLDNGLFIERADKILIGDQTGKVRVID